MMGVIRGSVEPGETDDHFPNLPFDFICFQLVVTPAALCVCVHRQICDLWEPQGQLGPRSHRPKQWDVGHAGIDQSAGHDGQAG